MDEAVIGALRELGAAVYFKPIWLEDLVAITKRLLSPNTDRSAEVRRLNLLLIDDCVAERRLYESALTPEFDVVTASRGAEGITAATRAHPDAIVRDVLMPGIDGWETCTRIKCDPRTEDIRQIPRHRPRRRCQQLTGLVRT